MGNTTKIEWTDATWNPIIGCSRVSEGCRNCYAERIAARFGNGKATVYSGLTQIVNGHPVWTGKVVETRKLLEPLYWRKPKMVFVNSMSDLFHENVTDEQRDRIFAVMALTPQHFYQVLTKRPERMLEYFAGFNRPGAEMRAIRTCAWVADDVANPPHAWIDLVEQIPRGLPNVWLGVSVEDQATADKRIPLLLKTPAAVRFLSCEPLLGALDLCPWLPYEANRGWDGKMQPKLDWVIAGGESGPGARPCHPDWIRSLRDQCEAAEVPFFFKQWGEWLPYSQGARPDDRFGQYGHIWPDGQSTLIRGSYNQDPEMGLYAHDLDGNDGASCVFRVGKTRAGHKLDGRQWHEFPPQIEAVLKGAQS
jgi:protein gp37